MDLKNMIDTAKDEGRKEGEFLRTLEIARSMKDQGVSTEIIAASTGLSVEEIQKL